MSNEGALANLDDDAAIQAIAEGAILRDFAEQYGCSVVAVHKRLKKHPDYLEAVKIATHNQVQVTTKELMTCDSDSDTVNLARARARHALDIAKVRNPDYADQSKASITIVDIAAVISEARKRSQSVAQTPNTVTIDAVRLDQGQDGSA